MIYKIPVVTRIQDNGDGGWSAYVYNNEDELIDYHYANRDGDITPERREQILTEHDPYQDGYIGSREIEIEVEPGQPIRLAKPLGFHGGQ